MRSPLIRRLRLGLVSLAPLLVGAACNEADVTIPYPGFVNGYVGRQEIISVGVVNAGGVDARLGEVSTAALGLAPPFTHVGGTCVSGGTIPKSYGRCTIDIAFVAARAEQYSDTLEIAYTWGDGSERRVARNTITGTATPPLQIQWDVLAFDRRPLESVSETPYTLRNAGGHPVTLGDLSTQHLDLAAPFRAVGGTCLSGATVAPGASCSVVVRFEPLTVGRFEETLEVGYNWAESGVSSATATARVWGSSVPPISIAATPLIVPPTRVGATATQTLTVTNGGGQIAVLAAADEAGLGILPPFRLAGGTCRSGLALQPNGGSCTLELAFSPSAPGVANEQLELRFGWGGVPGAFAVSHAVSATGVPAESILCEQAGCDSQQVCMRLASGGTTELACVTVPDPPPGCLAPCIWETQKRCLPVLGACSWETTPDPSIPNSDIHTVCDANTGWAIRQERRFQSVPFDTLYRKDGATCYGTSLKITGGPYEVVHSSGSAPVAISTFTTADINRRTTWCGPHTSAAGLDPAQSYPEDWGSPACVAWRNLYLGPTYCRSETAGSCAGF